ncbi:HIT domain-containing protein [Candidatus Pacearchaeota archaeon]|nr:HIT domain-containing protein [Candidatus Pacearchaeota archaeon]
MKDCVFCKIVDGIKKDQKIIYENENFFSVFDISPLTEGHSLVISKKHFKTTLDLQNSLGSELLDCIKNTALFLVKEKKAEGFNVLNNNFPSAGQFVNHVHFHIIPRKKDDELKMIV